MCGIVGYIGGQAAAAPDRRAHPARVPRLRLGGHRRARPAGARAGRAAPAGCATSTTALPKRFAGKIGIGHTRWATHGAATDGNAHPHADAEGGVAVVHNGIIDNARGLRAELDADGVELTSDTDTEAIAHLIARSGGATRSRTRASRRCARLEGTYALAVLARAHFPTASWSPATAPR